VADGCIGRLADVSYLEFCRTGKFLTRYRIELGIGWFGDCDGYDFAALNLLSHGPPVSDRVCTGDLYCCSTY
jgi:hypothetical protein